MICPQLKSANAVGIQIADLSVSSFWIVLIQYNNAIKEANHNLYAIKIISKYFTIEEKMTLLTFYLPIQIWVPSIQYILITTSLVLVMN